MRTVEYELGGQTYHLCMNGTALFDVYEKFGTEKSVSEHIQGPDKESHQATCWMLAKFAEQGELVRRFQGHTPAKIPTEHFFRAMLLPTDLTGAANALMRTIRLGFVREEPDEQPKRVDLGLRELQKKTGPG